MLAELEILPIGTKTKSLSTVLAEVVKLVDASGLEYRVGPMGTVVEGEWDQVMSLAHRCHEAILQSCGRVITTIKIDDRTDQSGPRIAKKVQSLERASGLSFTR